MQMHMLCGIQTYRGHSQEVRRFEEDETGDLGEKKNDRGKIERWRELYVIRKEEGERT